jgi:hypothetical protein
MTFLKYCISYMISSVLRKRNLLSIHPNTQQLVKKPIETTGSVKDTLETKLPVTKIQ